jgi:hypothetical protein
MGNLWRDRFVSSSCVSGNHNDCYHVHGSPLPGSTSSGFFLCRCNCHATCALSNVGAEKVTPQLCTCPGMIAWQERQEKSGQLSSDSSSQRFPLIEMFQVMREGRKQRRLRREAESTVAAAATGKSREEVRDMLLAEFARRGLNPPPQPRLDNLADSYRTQDPVERARLIQEGDEMFREATSALTQHAKWLVKPPQDKDSA